MKAGLASRNIVHLQNIILRCVGFWFYIFFIYMWSRLDHYWSNVYQQDHRSGCVFKNYRVLPFAFALKCNKIYLLFSSSLFDFDSFRWRVHLGRSVTPNFLSRNRFYSQLSPHCPKMNKKSMWEVKKISRFLSTGHRMPSCGCKSRETMVARYELVL